MAREHTSALHNTSEIGRLRTVMLHRPGRELENLMPEYLERLLFDDIPYLKVAQEEHDAFAKCLADNGIDYDFSKRGLPPFKARLVEGLKGLVFALVPNNWIVRVQNALGAGAKESK